MIRRPPRSTLSSSSAASDVYKRQAYNREGILVAHLRLSESDGCVIGVDHEPAIVSHHDHLLVQLLIRRAHLESLHQQLGQPAHLSAVLTLGRLRQKPFSVHITRANFYVKAYIKSCPVCLRYLAEPATLALGSPRVLRYFKKYNLSLIHISEPTRPY